MVERQLPKLNVAGSSPVSRSKKTKQLGDSETRLALENRGGPRTRP